ncbi:MAG: Lrp/AsnC family transcriptional regulator [Acidilobaceae archaeon]|nr:Lrp/AsnC family transcriptional regulator [Acidilobaceae archaeon]
MVKQLDSYEEKALSLIKARGSVLQSELWKELGLDSREGSRLVQRLVRKGLLDREEVVMNGRRTYKLSMRAKNSREQQVLVSLDSIMDLPCIVCPYLDQCEPGNAYEPATCPLMDNWVEILVSGQREKLSPRVGHRS